MLVKTQARRSWGGPSALARRPHLAGGLGIRGLALPVVVAYFDVAYGESGLTAFSSVNYPF